MPQTHTQVTMIGGLDDPTSTDQFIIDHPDSNHLRLLARIASDLDMAERQCRLFLEEEGRDDPHVDALAAFSETALVAIGRHKHGAGGVLPQTVRERMTDEEKDELEWVLSLRDKFVAHSVNQLSRTFAMVELNETGSVHDVFAVHMRVVVPRDFVVRTMALAGVLRAHLAAVIAEASTELRRRVDVDHSMFEARGQIHLQVVEAEAIDYINQPRGNFGIFEVPG
ncbi:hypothetical protein HOW07_09985 [Plantibacter sp. MCCC 1A11337]|uniref:hypothetical protein n=1 Tax=Plantibacter sp. MCCC 1A11337 TaxID=2736644 RepID=UPI0015842E49|nr:hypothetical protein [Plantibacter sp. MCCC 1A11337]NUJ88338.1 hypothetical protein [Plantibacter sp. MCCC 1A11337]